MMGLGPFRLLEGRLMKKHRQEEGITNLIPKSPWRFAPE
ncbi:MAG: hypothetical protein AVDCRST_MAG93-5369 [uncultured Chloroflexia bacterium]|uniref:Uncharacterized protein n=1 Tax=uncultured Chloroflexia bacterium TaxID=1672391 RepID=A0A6J4KT22_9CHLR|nr:MAG: hypothetical protein AVDCRST_MAG93-5369 [uncultured Chloroflexia bacterium]